MSIESSLERIAVALEKRTSPENDSPVRGSTAEEAALPLDPTTGEKEKPKPGRPKKEKPAPQPEAPAPKPEEKPAPKDDFLEEPTYTIVDVRAALKEYAIKHGTTGADGRVVQNNDKARELFVKIAETDKIDQCPPEKMAQVIKAAKATKEESK